ncbi:VirB4 family type IV secretion system protein [Fusibacter sp. JL216-2]|uniref:VirB4 family type IV secretion system protein n=1 Tax=Fusibacter sp. JL216-2 TaxID=3071453 RepID=UPI003D345D04
MKKTQNNQVTVNNSLLNIITPIGLELKRNSLIVGENKGRIYGIVKYPQKVDYGWLAKITNIPGTVVGITFIPIDNGEFISGLSKNVIQNRSAADSAKDPLIRQRAEQAAMDGEKIMLQIDREGETVGTMIISIMVISREENNFQKICRKTESIIATSKAKLRIMANLQEQAFKSVAPYYTLDEAIGEVLKRVIPMSSFVGGFPFSSSGYNDGTGYYFGRDSTGGLVVLDPWKRGNDRTNTNFTIMGVAGVGKSTVVKHIALSEYMKGTKIIFIDPEREYQEITKALNGDWINTGGGVNGKINPLQIRPTPVDDDDKYYKDEGHGMGDMAIYMKNLEIFFSLYLPSLSDKQRAILKNVLIELYNHFGIRWDTDINILSNEDFPVFSDLYELFKEKANKEKTSSSKNEYEELALLLQDIALGSDAFLWNGKSTIKTSSRCICLDTHDLQNTSDNIKRTQYFNILTWCWQQMSLDRNEPVLLICDESYLMIDPNVPQSLVFLRNVEKRARKYEAGVAIISHSVVDFLDPKIKLYGQALLDIPAYKILMGCDGMNLIETKKLYNLTDAEEQLLGQKKRGNALVMIGSKRLHVNFQIPDYKFEFMGKAGGR